MISFRSFAGAMALGLALGVFNAPVRAQSAQEWAVQGMGNTPHTNPPSQGGRVNKRFARRVMRTESRLAGVYAPLAAKAREIESACGSIVISGRRHTRVAGTRRWSLHASGHAVDMRGDPGCIYARLRGFAGGYSTDYGRVRHVHISLGGREDGLRFAHHRGRRHHHRYASR